MADGVEGRRHRERNVPSQLYATFVVSDKNFSYSSVHQFYTKKYFTSFSLSFVFVTKWKRGEKLSSRFYSSPKAVKWKFLDRKLENIF